MKATELWVCLHINQSAHVPRERWANLHTLRVVEIFSGASLSPPALSIRLKELISWFKLSVILSSFACTNGWRSTTMFTLGWTYAHVSSTKCTPFLFLGCDWSEKQLSILRKPSLKTFCTTPSHWHPWRNLPPNPGRYFINHGLPPPWVPHQETPQLWPLEECQFGVMTWPLCPTPIGLLINPIRPTQLVESALH